MGSPALISFPHFLHADPSLLEDVIGVSPAVEEEHMMLLDMIQVRNGPVADEEMEINKLYFAGEGIETWTGVAKNKTNYPSYNISNYTKRTITDTNTTTKKYLK